MELTKGACFMHEKRYRFYLFRIWDTTKPMIMFIGLNPSKADETIDDPTIRRVVQYAVHWGYGGIYMFNCFPFVSTDPHKINPVDYIEENDIFLKEFSKKCKEIVFAWGNFDIVKTRNRDADMVRMFPDAKALVINKNGSPRHPLYVPVKTPLVKFVN